MAGAGDEALGGAPDRDERGDQRQHLGGCDAGAPLRDPDADADPVPADAASLGGRPLGGTNDLLWAHGTASDDEQAIAAIARMTRAAGAELIVSTVPPVGPQWKSSDADAARAALNGWIRRHFHGDHLIDLYAHVAVAGSLPLAAQAAADGVHLSAAVDRWFAGQAVARLLRLLGRRSGHLLRLDPWSTSKHRASGHGPVTGARRPPSGVSGSASAPGQAPSHRTRT